MPTVTSLKPAAAPAPPLADDYSFRLCEQLARWRYEDLPAEVVRALKFFLIDTLGVIAGAPNAAGIRELNQRMHNRLRMHNDIDAAFRDAIKPARFNDLKAFVHHRCRVNGYLSAHFPRRVV